LYGAVFKPINAIINVAHSRMIKVVGREEDAR
jgi:hypothetical protein